MSRYMIIGTFLQCIFLSLLLADNSVAQRKSINDIYITLHAKKNVLEIFNAIEQQTELHFSFNHFKIKEDEMIEINVDKSTLREVLEEISKSTNLQFRRVNENIHVTKATRRQDPVIEEINLNQATTITGNITASDSPEGLPGVNVVIKGTSQGTVSDLNGDYRIDVPGAETTLVFSSVGYLSEDVLVGNRSTIDLNLTADITALDEIVVVGYGSVKKSDLTGSVSSVSGENLTLRPMPTIGSALQGQAAGVLVRTSSAAPGGDVNITIRGNNSFQSGSGPLYVVDGIPLSDINSIAPEDVASLEVLKDASATAVYGSRGANGVILITTKKGKKGETNISYSGRYTVESMPKEINLMNGEQFATIFTEYEKVRNPNITDAQLWFNGSAYGRPRPEDAGVGTNWWDEVTRTGIMQNHQIGINGGSDKSTYSVSLNYLDHKGMIIGGDFKRFGLRTSNTYGVTDWLDAGLDLFVTRTMRNSSGENTPMDQNSGIIDAVYKFSPAQNVYREDGSYSENLLSGAAGNQENPVARTREQINANRMQRAFGNAYLKFKPTKDLNIKISAGGDTREGRNLNFNPSTTIQGGFIGGSAGQGANSTNYFISENIVSYNKEIGAHRFDVIGGFTYEQTIADNFSASANGFLSDVYKYNNLGAANIFNNPSSNKTKWSLASGLSRINYIFNDKYLLTATARYDGSSRFGEGNKWGFFPSLAAAWRVSDEEFMNNQTAVSDLKLRVSYGETGNSNIGLYQSLSTYAIGNYPFGGQVHPGVYANSLDNRDLQWETTSTANIGVDLRLFDKVNFTVDAYQKTTTEALLWVALIETSGHSSALRNVGSLQNRGLEIAADATVVDRAVKWNLSGNISTNRSEVLALNGDATQEWRIGQPFGAGRGFVIDGILATQEDLDDYLGADGNVMNGAQLGDYRVVDTNGDGIISGEDQIVIYDPNPDFTYFLHSDLSYKNFSLGITIYGSQGNQIANGTRGALTNLLTIRNNLWTDVIGNYWTPERTTGVEYAALNSTTYNQAWQTSIEDGSYLRVQNIILSYNLPLKKIFKSARIYASGQNLITLTKYTGFDPDVVNNDNNSFPLPKSITFGIDITP